MRGLWKLSLDRKNNALPHLLLRGADCATDESCYRVSVDAGEPHKGHALRDDDTMPLGGAFFAANVHVDALVRDRKLRHSGLPTPCGGRAAVAHCAPPLFAFSHGARANRLFCTWRYLEPHARITIFKRCRVIISPIFPTILLREVDRPFTGVSF